MCIYIIYVYIYNICIYIQTHTYTYIYIIWCMYSVLLSVLSKVCNRIACSNTQIFLLQIMTIHIKLIRTDTTLDLSQKAEKRWLFILSGIEIKNSVTSVHVMFLLQNELWNTVDLGTTQLWSVWVHLHIDTWLFFNKYIVSPQYPEFHMHGLNKPQIENSILNPWLESVGAEGRGPAAWLIRHHFI